MQWILSVRILLLLLPHGCEWWMFLLVPAHLGSPGQRAVKRLCVRGSVCVIITSWNFVELSSKVLFCYVPNFIFFKIFFCSWYLFVFWCIVCFVNCTAALSLWQLNIDIVVIVVLTLMLWQQLATVVEWYVCPAVKQRPLHWQCSYTVVQWAVVCLPPILSASTSATTSTAASAVWWACLQWTMLATQRCSRRSTAKSWCSGTSALWRFTVPAGLSRSLPLLHLHTTRHCFSHRTLHHSVQLGARM